jgi:hypothetical protein
MAEKGMVIVIVMTGTASTSKPTDRMAFSFDRRQAETGLLSVAYEAPTPRRNASQPFS